MLNRLRLGRGSIVLHIPAAVLLVVAATGTVWAQDIVTSQSQNSGTIGQYEKFELTFTLSRTYTNPFDVAEVDIRVKFTEPGGSERTVPAFYYMEYDAAPGDPEQYVNGRNPCWKARFSPTLTGVHSYQIIVADHLGTETIAGSSTFACTAKAANKGFIRLDTDDPYLLRRSTGEQYFPIGHNVGWAANNTGLAWWTRHFDGCARGGVTWARIWMTHFYVGQNIEWSTTDGSYFHGVGRYSTEIAWKLDRIVEAAEQRGIAIQLTLQHHGQFSSSTNSNWDRNPYNAANAAQDGGWLNSAADFFTDAEARRLTRNKYRYIVARWGYSTAIHSWELWNEVQYTDGWASNASSVVAWHGEMSQYLHDVDAFGHLVTTSADQSGFNAIWALPAINLVEVHSYTSNILGSMQSAVEKLHTNYKPVLTAEYGLVAGGAVPEIDYNSRPEPYRTQLRQGLHFHNGMWAAFHLRNGGHLWWWDTYIEALDLFGMYKPLADYAAGEDLGKRKLSAAVFELNMSGSAKELIFQPNTPGISDFGAGSQQTTFTVDTSGRIQEFWKQTVYLHGSSKAQWRSDPILNTSFTEPFTLRLYITEVSGWGGNGVRILADGSPVASLSPANGATNLQLDATIPAGTHTVQVQNTGDDWLKIENYGFAGSGSNFLQGIGLSSDDSAYLWIYDVGSQYGYSNHGTVADATFKLYGMKSGAYTIEYYRTWDTGGKAGKESVVPVEGVITGTLPHFIRDIAVKVKPANEAGLPVSGLWPQGILSGAALLCGARFLRAG